MLTHLRHYLGTQASSLPRYLLQELVLTLFGWIPSLPGMILRGLAYKLILKSEGLVGIESNVRLVFTENIRLGRGAFLDHGVYLHACPGGIDIGERAFIMHN